MKAAMRLQLEMPDHENVHSKGTCLTPGLAFKDSPPTGTSLTSQPPKLFQPFQIRSLTFQNRIWVSPMCTYSSAANGLLTSWHFTHYATLLLRGPSLVIIEATAVHPSGRISTHCCGIWSDDQIPPLKKLVDFAHSQGQKIGIQLAHAGRKASTIPIWNLPKGKGSVVAEKKEGGWPDEVVGPSAIRWGDGFATPRELTETDVADVIQQFVDAAKRAVRAGIDTIEIHGAHGYLISSFLSSRSNCRTDSYGGSFKNRVKIAIAIVEHVRKVIPADMPLLFRLSATEWTDFEDSWNLDDTCRLADLLSRAGVDVITISSGGMDEKQRVPQNVDYQTKLAAKVRQTLRQEGNTRLAIGAVGRITSGLQARDILEGGESAGADVVLLGRAFMRDPSWVLNAASSLCVKVVWPRQYMLAIPGHEGRLYGGVSKVEKSLL